MENVLYVVVGAIQLAIAIKGTRDARKHGGSLYTTLLLIVVYGLAYDNFAIASGSVLGEGALTKALNWPRYAIHALFTPAMMIVAFGQLRRGGVGFAQSKTWHAVICTVSTVMILLGSYIDIINLELVPAADGATFRYVNGFEFMAGPPIPAVLTIIVVLAFGIVAWRSMKWPWLFAGAALMFVTAPMLDFQILQNAGEIAFAAGLVFTEIHVQSLDKS